jgi:PKD repeat protein
MTKRAMSVLMILALLAVQAVGNVTPAHAETCEVTTAADSGTGSLRALLADSTCTSIYIGGDYTINLASPLTIDHDVYISPRYTSDTALAHRVTLSGDSNGDGTGDVRVMMVSSGVTATLDHLTIADGNCGAGCNGGGILNNGTTYIRRSTLLNNTAESGGAIYNSTGGFVHLSNTTLSGNNAADGGALYNEGGGAQLRFVTASENSASSSGGVVYTAGGELIVHLSILWDNPAGDNAQIANPDGATNVAVDHSVVQGGYTGVGNTAEDPLLSELGYYSAEPTRQTSWTKLYGILPGSSAWGLCEGDDYLPLVDTSGDGDDSEWRDQRGNVRGQIFCDAGSIRRFREDVGGMEFACADPDPITCEGSFVYPRQYTPIEQAFPEEISFSIVYSQWDDTEFYDEPSAGTLVYFEVPGSGTPSAMITPNPATVGEDEVVRVHATANDIAGDYTVRAYILPDPDPWDNGLDLFIRLGNECVDSRVVTNDSDSGPGSLRHAILGTCHTGTITFDNDYTIVLESTLPDIGSRTIDGEDHSVTISGDNQVQIMVSHGNPVLKNLTIADGYCGAPSCPGAGVLAYDQEGTGTGLLTATNVVFRGNEGSDGGAIGSYSSSVALTNVVFSGNHARSNGGALVLLSSYTENTLDNVTFTGNAADSYGGAMYIILPVGITINNSIMWGNSAPDGAQVYFNTPAHASFMTVSSSDIQGGLPDGVIDGGGNLAVDPQFVDADGVDDVYGTADDDVRLANSSPLIDAGNNTLVPLDVTDIDMDTDTAEILPFDLARQARFADLSSVADTGTGTAPIVDMGAYEMFEAVNNVPVLSGISPASAVAASGDLALTVTGSDFISGSTVRWNGADLATTYVSDTQLSATIPGGNLASVQTAQITVFTPEPGGGTSNVLAFFVTEATAGVTSQDVASGTDPSATSGAAAASASGDGLLVVAEYDANPGGTPSFSASGAYFDVYAAPDNSFTQVTIEVCSLTGSDNLFWWDGTGWVKAYEQTFADGCITLTVNDTSSPTLSQLQATYFGTGNTAPTADPGGSYSGLVDTDISFDGSGSSDPDGDALTYAWTFGDETSGEGVMPTHSYAEAGTYGVCLTVSDGSLDSEPVCTTAEVTALNTAPTADPGGPYVAEVDTAITFDGSGSSDPDGDALTYAWTFGDGGTGSGVYPAHAYTADGTYNVCLTVNDGTVDSDTICTQATISEPSNTPPAADPGGPYLVAVNASIVLDGSGSSDPDGDALTETWTADGGTVSDSTYTAGSETGIYDVCLTVNDGTADSAEACTIVVVYDPSAGFVTGGGWIDSPAGAYKPDPSLSGKATFGFVSKYKKGASVPEGNTEFQFQAGGFNFHSETYDWLVVNQNGTNAQFKGSGTVNGELDPNGEAYKFMIWAGDGDPDTFRIRIWWEGEDGVEHDVYDNGFEQAIGGGSIVVHAK